MNVKITQEDYIEILRLKIPLIEKPEDGFLEISNVAHHENINSSIYAYFLNQERREICTVFYEALYQLISEKLGNEEAFELDEYQVSTEVLTEKQNRIDILLDDKENEKAIIIENKIYHILNNDLDDYFKHLTYSNHNKLIIVLSLESYDFSKPLLSTTNFQDSKKLAQITKYNEQVLELYNQKKLISITHKEWVDKIREIKLPANLPSKLYIYLNDFFNTIDNLTKNTTMNESAMFYFQNASLVNKARSTYDQALAYVHQEIDAAAQILNMKSGGSKNNYSYRYIYDTGNKVFYTIIFENLFNGIGSIKIIIEYGGNFNKSPKRDEIKETLKEYGKFKMGRHSSSFYHLAQESYDFNISTNNDLSGFLVDTINNSFADLYNKLTEILNNKKTPNQN